MPLTDKEKQEIKESWEKYELSEVEVHPNKLVNFWLSTIESKIKEKLEEVEKEVYGLHNNVFGTYEEFARFAFNQCHSRVLSIINKHK